MTSQEIINAVRRELYDAERWGSTFYPCAVALTVDEKSEVLMNFQGHQPHTSFTPSGDMTLCGLTVALVPDSWKGPRVLLAEKRS